MDLKDLLADDPELAPIADRIKTVKDLAKSFKEAQKALSASVRMPAEGASTEEWGKWWEKQGRPASPDGYDLPEEGEPGAIELARALAPAAHGAGLTKKQLRALADRLVGVVGEQAKATRDAMGAARQANEEAMRAKLGAQFEPTMAGIRKWMADNFGADQAGAFKDLGLDTHPALEGILARAALATGPDKLPNVFGGKGGMEGADAKSLAKKWLQLNNSEPILKGRGHPMFQATVQEIDEVMRQIADTGYEGRIPDLLGPGDLLQKTASPHKTPSLG